MKGNRFTGTGTLLRLYLRRDRVVLPIWLIILAILPMSTAASYIKLYGSAGKGMREVAALIASSPALRAVNGPVFGANIGALAAWKIFVTAAILVGLMSMLTVIKHTRTEEETGRSELLGSTVVGRLAPLTAAFVETFGANLVLAALVAGGLVSTGLSASGSFAFGLSCAAFGWLFAAVAGVAAQLTPGAGAAKGIAGTGLGLFFLLRLVGDAGEGGNLAWLSWASPMGLAQRIRPFAGERWWILALFMAISVAAAAIAYVLAARRDVGAGILQPHPGPAQASPGFSTPLALAWRLHRGSLLAWSAGFALFGALMGSVAGGIAGSDVNFFKDNPQFGDLLSKLGGQSGPINTLFAAMTGISGIVVSIYAIQAALRARSEEETLHAESVLSTAVGRSRWATSHLVFAFFGPAVMMAAYGLASGLFYGLGTANAGHEMARLLAAAMVQLPAIWVLAAIAVTLFGLAPRLISLCWAALVAFLLLGQLGDLLKLSRTVMNFSPFTHIPKLPGGEVTVAPLIWLVAIAAALTAAGLAGLRRRDIGRA